MPVNNNPSFQWANWMAAAYEAAQRMNPTTVEPSKDGPVDNMCGGWRYEGKEKPVTPIICTRCQWTQRTAEGQEPDKSTWCESCLEGKILGHGPAGPKKPYVSPGEDVKNYNNAFFGGGA